MYMQVPYLSQNQRFPHTFIFESLLHFYVQCMELKGCNILNIVIYTVLSSTLPLCSCPKWWWAVPFSCLMLYNVCYVCPTSKLAAGKCQYIKRTCSLDEVNLVVSYHFPIASCTGTRENAKMGEDGQELGQVYSRRKGEESFLLVHVHISFVCRVRNWTLVTSVKGKSVSVMAVKVFRPVDQFIHQMQIREVTNK